MSATAADLSQPNLVKMDTTTMEEVNNNSFIENDAKQNTFNLTPTSITENNLVIEKIQAESQTPTLISNPGESNKDSSSVSNESSIYCLNDNIRLTVTYTEEWLCVARMPLDFTKAEFDNLLLEYGPVSQSFLIHSETSGTFKGYGLVKYVSKESSIQARHVLDGHEIRNGHFLNCDWLKQNNPGVTSLHSKCLYVDKLPESYRDMAEFRRLFSKVVNPPYCQIAIKNGVIHNWGLVEFQTSQEAEDTFQALQGQCIQNQPIRVQYCIPGVHAINIYMSFVNDPMDAVQERKALLDETPSSKVYEQLGALAKQNPWFVANLQTIMASSAISGPLPSCAMASLKAGTGSNGSAPADPAQAALILLLAGKVAKGPTEQTTNLLQGIVKQMTNGVKASEILRTILPSSNPSHNEADLIQTAINMAGTNSTSNSIDESSSKNSTSQASSTSSSRSDKCPLLMELLYKSFQARLAKEQRLKLALKEQQQQQQQKSSLKPTIPNTSVLKTPSASTVMSTPIVKQPPNSNPAGMVSNPNVNNNQVSVNNMTAAAHVASAANNVSAMAASEAALAAAMMQAQFLLSPDQTLLTQAVQPQTPQPTVPAYPTYFPYYSQMINPGLAWPFTAAQATPTITSTVTATPLIPEVTPQAQLMIPHVMHYNQVGVKRAAAPVMYANVEKRMKLA